MKQMSIPSFWEDVGVRKWSPFLVWGARSPIFGRLNMGTFDNFGQNDGIDICFMPFSILDEF